jgi:hypothetical protein
MHYMIFVLLYLVVFSPGNFKYGVVVMLGIAVRQIANIYIVMLYYSVLSCTGAALRKKNFLPLLKG